MFSVNRNDKMNETILKFDSQKLISIAIAIVNENSVAFLAHKDQIDRSERRGVETWSFDVRLAVECGYKHGFYFNLLKQQKIEYLSYFVIRVLYIYIRFSHRGPSNPSPQTQ